jgi:hypothetical protein
MNLFWAGALVVGVTAVAVTVMLLVRRRAPEGSYFEDGDRAAAVFGVIATAFAVLIGFVVFLAFESYDTSRSGGEAEARTVAQQFETAQFLPASARRPLSGELVCYARSVVYQEWPKMQSGASVDVINAWTVPMLRTLRTVEPKSASEQTAYSKWFDQRFDRVAARADRLHGAEGVIPAPLWIVLFFSAAVIFIFMLFFADSAERAIVQATMMGGVAAIVTSTLILLSFLNSPYHHGIGGLPPTQMKQTIARLQQEAALFGGLSPPCDSRGIARR